MASSSITYKDTKVSVKAISDLDTWIIRITIESKKLLFTHVIDEPFIYTQAQWLSFLERSEYVDESSDDLALTTAYPTWACRTADDDEPEVMFDMQRTKSKYVFRRGSAADFQFAAGPLDICLRDIINKALIMGFKFADE